MDHIIPGSGQESVWDYPRPPRAETCGKSLTIVFADQVLVETTRSIRVLETSHPPVYYISLNNIEPGVLLPTVKWTPLFGQPRGLNKSWLVVLGGP